MHTLELLLTSRLGHLQIILAKLFSSFLMAAFMIALTFVFPIVLAVSGYGHWGVVLTSYLGILLCVMCYLAVGLFASSLTDNQVVSAVLGFSILLGIMLFVLTANSVDNYMVGQIFNYFSITAHYESFVKGSINSFDLFYLFSFTGFFIYLTHLSLDSRRW